MNSTNVDKTALAEKVRLDNSFLPATSTAHIDAARAAQRRRAIMSRVQHICFVVLALALLAVTLANANVVNEQITVVTDAQQFRQLLETIDDTTLHEILHDHFKGKYQHGIFEEDKAALESLHRENATVATSLVQLAKRQTNGNGTVITSTTVVETTEEVTITSTSVPNDPPTTEPTLPPTTTEPTPTPSTSSEPSVEPTPTPSPTSSSSTAVETTASDTTSSSTISTSSTIITSTSSTLGTILAYTNSSTTYSNTSVPSTTFTLITSSSRPLTTSRTSTEEDTTTEVVYTTTLANGVASVVTRVTVVPASVATQIQRPSSSTTRDSNASLQTGNSANTIDQHGWTAGMGVIGMVVAWAI